MKGITVFEAMTDIRGDYILDAEITPRFLAAPTRKKEKSPSAFSLFMNSGWGVAIICALVAVSVMGGIIWAGFNAENVTPVGAQPTEDLTFEQETMEDIDPPAAEIAAKAPKFGWEKSVKSVQTTAFYSLLTYNMLEMGEYHVTEISLATREDDTRTLMFRLINRETYEVMARYSWDVTEGKWGVMDYGGFFAVYCATEKGEQTLMNVDVFWWRPELDPHSYEYMGRHIPTVEESTTYIWKSPNAKDTAEWSRFTREWFTDWPTTYLCMDEALGDLAFYTEDNRYTDGWARMRLLWQDLYILDGEETTGGLEIVTEVCPEVVVTDEVGSEDIVTDIPVESESETVKTPFDDENSIRCAICGEYGCDCIVPPETLPPQDETSNGLEVPTEPETIEPETTEPETTEPETTEPETIEPETTEPETTEPETIEPETTEPETEPEITTEMLLPPTEPASDDLEFYITQNVEDVDFSDHAEIYGWFGAREFLGKGYDTVPVEGSTPIRPEHYVSYVIGAYPDEADGGQYVTQITITDPQVTYYGLTVHSTAEVFRETLERLGYTVKISVKSNGETFSAEKGNLRVSLNKWENEQPKLHVVAEVTNREGIIY